MAKLAYHCHPLCVTRHRTQDQVCDKSKLINGFEYHEEFDDVVFDNDLIVDLNYPLGSRKCGCVTRGNLSGVPYHTRRWQDWCQQKAYSELVAFQNKLDEEHRKWVTVQKARDEAKTELAKLKSNNPDPTNHTGFPDWMLKKNGAI